VNVEAAPRGVLALWPEDGLLVHTNHFLDSEALCVTEPPSEREEHSIHRLKRAHELLREKCPLALDDLRECLRDHEGYPYGICRHIDEEELPHERYQTVVSVLMDLHTRTLWISDGPPCESAYQELRLGLEA
jgi:isopenicillin-N N-acyltransferase-like protein